LILREKYDVSKPTLEIVLSINSKEHSHSLHRSNLGIEANIIKEVLLSFSMNNFINKDLNGIFSLNVCQTLLGESCLLDYYVSCH